MPEVDLFGDNNVPKGTELYDARIGKIQAEIHNYLRQGVVPGAIQQILTKLDNISVDADTVNLNTDQLETKLDTLNGLLTTLQTDTALVKASAANVDSDLGSPSESAASTDTSTSGLNGLLKRLLQRITALIPANLTVSSTRLLVDGSGVTQPVSDRGASGEATVSTFTSTSSATLKASNASRKLLTIFNEGAGNLHILYGAGTASTTNYSVRVNAGEYLEIEKYTGEIRAIFATAGTARVTEIT